MLTVANYELQDTIHSGEKTVIYRCFRSSDKKPFFLKTTNSQYPSAEAVDAFEHEYTLLTRLNSPYLLQPVELGNQGNRPFLLFNNYNGQLLSQLPKFTNTLALNKILELAVTLVKALQELHSHQLIFKDLTPLNILLESNSDNIKLLNLELAAETQPLEDTLPHYPSSPKGNLTYIAPEQTGRMHRVVDYRCDFYSLGIILYELLTSTPPFVTDDPIQLVHAHIAREPISPHLKNSSIPETVSEIVQKLLSKIPDERYSNPSGLLADLQRCLTEYKENGVISFFQLGSKDISPLFYIPSTLWGRRREHNILLQDFSEVQKGQTRLKLITGPPGIGKTSLVQYTRRTFTEKGALFISGKFDQYQSDTPYTPLTQAFQELSRQILARPPAEIELWRNKLLQALGSNAQIINSVIPEMEFILGEQPDVPELDPAESENRFKLLFKTFVRTCATQEQPLIIFFDDMQWSDKSTLNLLHLLVTDPAMVSLYVLGSYRGEDVSDSQSISQMLASINDSGITNSILSLSPLDLEGCNNLLAEALYRPPEDTLSLAETCLQKTSGNPFFLKEFLYALAKLKLLFFAREENQWQWDLAAIRQMNLTDNVVTFLTSKINTLPPATQQLLKVGACIGNNFDLETLSLFSEKTNRETMAQLDASLAAGLLIQTTEAVTTSATPALSLKYRFAHDHIHKVIYSQIAENECKQYHLELGRLLLKHLPQHTREQQLFQLVGQFNNGQMFISSWHERIQVAKLNLDAGRKAKKAAAYGPANSYMQAGLQLLNRESWQKIYQICLDLHVEGAETAYLIGDLATMDQLCTTTLEQATTLLDKIKIYEVRIQALKAQNRLAEAVETSLEALRLLGVNMPRNPGRQHAIAGMIALKCILYNKSTEDLLNLKTMHDPLKQAIMRIILSIGTAAYYSMPELFPLLAFKAIRLSLSYGNSEQSTIMGYPTYGFLLCGVTDDIQQGYNFGILSINLQKQLHNGEVNPLTRYLVNNLILHWKEHIRDTLPGILESYEKSLQIGELEIAANAAYSYSYRLYFLGENLQKVDKEMSRYRTEIEQLGQEIPLYRQKIFQQVVSDLRHQNPLSNKLQGDFYNEEEMLDHHLASNDKTTLFILYLNKSILAYLFGRHEHALEMTTRTRQLLKSVISSIFVPIFYWYDSLIHLAVLQKCNQNKAAFLKVVRKNQKKMKKWAHHAPMNYKHKYDLVQAEQAKVEGKAEIAMRCYDDSIAGARKSGYLQELALAYELTANYYMEAGREFILLSYLREARHCYRQWGADAKVQHLDTHFEHMNLYREINTLTKPRTAPPARLNNENHSGFWLDLLTVIKASRALASEIVLDEFLESMIQIMMENAGAQRGFLLFEEHGLWVSKIKGELGEDGKVHVTPNPEASEKNLAMTVVNYVARAHGNLILHDATNEGIFTDDSYIALHKPKSIFCTAIIHQNKTSCILYLENNLVTGAFSTEREDILRHLGSQAAISLRNSSLYTELKETIQQLFKGQVGMTFAICKMAESRDPETGEHLERMREYCKVLALHLQQQPKYNNIIDDNYINQLYVASPLHDIGKVGIPDSILQKPGKLSAQEFSIMKNHSRIGEHSLNEINRLYPGNTFISMGAEIAGSHHEQWDGSGYPRGLSGGEIPLSGRILALGDVYDALTSKRVYKDALTHEKSREIIVEGSGYQFDPDVVDAFIATENEFIAIKEKR